MLTWHLSLAVQISNIRIIKEAMREASFLYAELLSLGAAMTTVDVGGGLGVDYEVNDHDKSIELSCLVQTVNQTYSLSEQALQSIGITNGGNGGGCLPV